MQNYIARKITPVLKSLAKQYPIVTITGPRQSGKSTLLKTEFPEYTYLSLENIDIRTLALEDPCGFLAKYPGKVILDEIQRAPQILSYLQTHVDNENKEGMYLLSGSQSFLMMHGLTQSLAGRTALLTLLPFSRYELFQAHRIPDTLDELIYRGLYPRLYNHNIDPPHYYPAYIQTYVERDVRDVLKVTDLSKFIKFIRLCAGRIGQILNLTSLANETGISSTTAEGWLSVLEASYICYRLQPYFKNFNKRIIKSPKLYFYDTGLACSLLGLNHPEQVGEFYMRGALFENLVINQFIKDSYNEGFRPDIAYWRDSTGNEIDLIVTKGLEISAYEIKSSATFNFDFFKTLNKWGTLAGVPIENLNVIYMGNESFKTKYGNIVSFPHTF